MAMRYELETLMGYEFEKLIGYEFEKLILEVEVPYEAPWLGC